MLKKVLVVDDSRVSRMMLIRTIQEIDSEWEVIEADGGEAAVEVVKTEEPSVVIMDFNMPGIDGIEAARRIKDARPSITLTMLTANIQNETRSRADEIGVGFLTKPIKKDDIAAFLRDLP